MTTQAGTPTPAAGAPAPSTDEGVQPGVGIPEGEAPNDTTVAPAPEGAAAPADDGAPAPQGPRFWRDEHRNAIAQRVREQRLAERNDPSLADLRARVAETAVQPDEGAPHTDDAAASPSAEGGSGNAPAPASAAPASQAPPYTRVKINGQQLDVPTADVEAAGGIATYQTLKAAEISLRAAKQLENQLRDRLTQAPQPAPAAPTAAAPAPGGKPAPRATAAGAHKDIAQELLDGVLESDAEAIARALGKFGSSQQPQPAAPTAPQPQPNARPPSIMGRPKDEVLYANQVFDTEFGHLRAQPGAFELAQEQILARMKDPQYAAMPLDMLVRDIGAKIGRLAGTAPRAPVAPSPTAAQALADRRTAKARLPISSSAGGSVPVNPAPPAPNRAQRNSAYIAQLRARSGSNTAMSERAAR